MSAASRKQRGNATQTEVARWFAQHGWPYAESTGAGRTGSDITGVPGLACEVKARRAFSPLAWIRQAAGSPGLPFVVHRPDGMGPMSVADWPVTLRLSDFTGLLQSAGYGDGKPCPLCNGSGAVDVETGCGGCSDYPGIAHEPACGVEPAQKGSA